MNYTGIVRICSPVMAMAFLLSACNGKECLSCTAGQPCPSFVGEYYGTIEELSDDCPDWDLVVGDYYLRILNQTVDADGYASFEGEDKDMRGVWGTISGNICNTDETEYPKEYPFGYGDTVFNDDGSSTNYQYNGLLVVPAQGDTSNYSFYGTLTITNNSSDGDSCTLVASVSGDMI